MRTENLITKFDNSACFLFIFHRYPHSPDCISTIRRLTLLRVLYDCTSAVRLTKTKLNFYSTSKRMAPKQILVWLGYDFMLPNLQIKIWGAVVSIKNHDRKFLHTFGADSDDDNNIAVSNFVLLKVFFFGFSFIFAHFNDHSRSFRSFGLV